ncbi:amidohydrolase [Gammaproteobacteria bacterium]|nr:amidohydrolase [Gammaproteobacteria bacterium]
MKRLALHVVFMISLSGCSPADQPTVGPNDDAVAGAADTVYTNGKIYTVNEVQPWVEAVAIKDGKFVAVGTNDDVASVTGANTDVIDLDGKFVMPGFSDAHLHTPLAYVEEEAGNLLMDALTADDVRNGLLAFAAANPGDGWIRAEKFRLGAFPGGKTDRQFLDAIIPDRPVFLMDETGHNGVANSKALELAGITKDTPQPEGGTFEIDPESGEPTGYLSETGIRAVGRVLVTPGVDVVKRALLRGMAEVRSLGVTSFIDMFSFTNSVKAYREIDDDGNLTFRVSAAVALNDYTDFSDTVEGAAETLSRRSEYETDRLRVDSFKYWADGTPMSYTSLLVEPYAERDTLGSMTMTPAHLARARELLDEGLVGRFHSITDGTARVVLDMVEAYRKDHPESTQPIQIGHNGLVHPDDLGRYSELNVIAEFSPAFWFPLPVNGVLPQYIGEERLGRWYAIAEMHRAGATVAIGSDWPAGTPTADPFRGLEGLVTRMDPWEQMEGQAGEPVSLEVAIRMMTLNTVKLMQREDEFGSLEVGKLADFIILDENPFGIEPARISNINVLQTIFDGKVVYDSSKDPGPTTRLDH